jgi:ubiquinone/menaquinone biosynthesis C-methylase UbiE
MSSQLYFDRIANRWNQIRQDYFKDDIRPLLFEKIDFENRVVADLGAGTGFLALEIARKANVVFALDHSQNMLNHIVKKAKLQNLSNVFAIESNLDSTVLIHEQIDIVTMNMALHHIDNPAKLIKEIYHMLLPGGTIVLSDVMEHDGVWAIEEMYDKWLGFNLPDVEKWILKAGFIEPSVTDTGLIAVSSNSKGETIAPHIFLAIAKKGNQQI